jgi:hypothetical protein
MLSLSKHGSRLGRNSASVLRRQPVALRDART